MIRDFGPAIQLPPVATRNHPHVPAQLTESLGEVNYNRGFAGSPDQQVAHHQHRHWQAGRGLPTQRIGGFVKPQVNAAQKGEGKQTPSQDAWLAPNFQQYVAGSWHCALRKGGRLRAALGGKGDLLQARGLGSFEHLDHRLMTCPRISTDHHQGVGCFLGG